MNEGFVSQVRDIILESRNAAIRSVDFQRVLMYWKIGEKIVLEDQGGNDRAVYGEKLIPTLAHVLEPEFGSGFAPRQLERARQFYRLFPDSAKLWMQFSWTMNWYCPVKRYSWKNSGRRWQKWIPPKHYPILKRAKLLEEPVKSP